MPSGESRDALERCNVNRERTRGSLFEGAGRKKKPANTRGPLRYARARTRGQNAGQTWRKTVRHPAWNSGWCQAPRTCTHARIFTCVLLHVETEADLRPPRCENAHEGLFTTRHSVVILGDTRDFAEPYRREEQEEKDKTRFFILSSWREALICRYGCI